MGAAHHPGPTSSCIADRIVARVDQASVSAGDSEAAAEGVQHLRARPLLSSNPLLDAVHVPGTYVMSSMASHGVLDLPLRTESFMLLANACGHHLCIARPGGSTTQ